jgi:LPS-assembly protein
MGRALVLLLASVLVLVDTASAQPRLRTRAAGGPVEIVADQFEERGGIVYATGNVEITQGQVRLKADRVEYNRQTGEAVATGQVELTDGEDRLTGRRIDYNVNTGTGVVQRAEVFSAPYYRLSADRLERIGDNTYQLYRGVFTTCEDDPPAWSFRAQSVTAELDEWVFGRGGSFWIKSLPLIPFIPFFGAPTGRERQTGFLIPTVGSSQELGVYTQIPFFWAISDSQDLTVSLDFYSDRGPGVNAQYRYILSRAAQGIASGFVVQEALRTNDTRWYLGLKHNWEIDPTLVFRADINRVQDDFVFKDYADRLSERSVERTESNTFVAKRGEHWNLVANILWYQDLTTRRAVELQRVPELRGRSVVAPIPGLPGFLYEIESSFTNFLRDLGSDGVRTDFHPRILYPVPVGEYFTVTPFVGGRATVYSVRAIGERVLVDGTRVELTEDDSRVRTIAELGSDVETRASRVYRMGGRWNVDRVLHAIEPRVGFRRAIANNASATPHWDQIDDEGERTRLTYSLINRLHARTVSRADAISQRWEILRLTLAQYYDFEAPSPTSDAALRQILQPFGRPFGPIIADLILAPTRTVQFRGNVEYDVHGEGVRVAIADVGLSLPNLTASLGARFHDPARIEFYQAQASARLSDRLTLRGISHFDGRQGVFVENRLGAEVRFQCWSVAVTYVNRTENDHGFRVSFGLLGVGHLGTRGGFGPDQQRSAVPLPAGKHALDLDFAPSFSSERTCS